MKKVLHLLKNNISNLNPYFNDLGKSYDSAFSKKRMYLLKGDVKKQFAPSSADKDIFYYKFISSQREFSKEIKISASAKASYGLVSGNASAKRKTFFSSNSYSCYIFGYIKLNQAEYVYDVRETKIIPEIQKFIDDNYPDNIKKIVKEIGDDVIVSLKPTSELMVKVEIKTNSKKEKEQIKASMSASGSIVSGSGKFSSVIEKLSNNKNVNIEVFGNIPDDFISNISADEIDKMLLEFPKTRNENFSVLEFSTIPIDDIPALIAYRDLFNLDELQERRDFIQTLYSLYEDLTDWKSDIAYVLTDLNKNEFEKTTLEKAKLDLQKCNDFLKKIIKLKNTAEIYWLKNGSNGDNYDLKRFDDFPIEFPIYQRVEIVEVPVATPPQPPKPRSKPDLDRYINLPIN